jgi:ubiquinol-cytochrome c reductase cytochrome b subunit
MLKVFEGPLEVVGSVVLPTLAVLALFLVPFVDRRSMVRVTQRTVAVGVVVLATIGWTALTVAAVVTTPKEASSLAVDYSAPTDWLQLSPEEMAGIGYFRKEGCSTCHSVGDGRAKEGPDLASRSIRKSAAWMIAHFKRPAAMVPGTSMPPIQLTDSQLNALAAFLLKLTPQNALALQNAPQFVVDGALIYQANRCGSCHLVNGVGMKIGPPLNGLSKRRTESWIISHFLDPQALAPGTVMPPYKLPPEQLESLTAYLLTLPD